MDTVFQHFIVRHSQLSWRQSDIFAVPIVARKAEWLTSSRGIEPLPPAWGTWMSTGYRRRGL
jgi:hypothetical protein